MPDITLAYAPSAGGATSASGFNGDVYTPATRTSFETINGWLDRDNREVSGSAWKASWDKIRPRSMAEAGSVGATNNLDWFPQLCPQDPEVSGAFYPIPGASKEVYVKRSGGTVLVVADLVISNSLAAATSNGVRLRLYRKAAGAAVGTELAGSQQVVGAGDAGGGRRIYRDRHYAFHYLDTAVARGNYTYYLGVWVTGSIVVTIGADGLPTNNTVSARTRCRSMTSYWIG